MSKRITPWTLLLTGTDEAPLEGDRLDRFLQATQAAMLRERGKVLPNQCLVAVCVFSPTVDGDGHRSLEIRMSVAGDADKRMLVAAFKALAKDCEEAFE